MKTIELLNEKGLDGLKLLNIIVNHEAELGVFSLVYDQINSPTGDPVVQECRGLIVANEGGQWKVISRGFDRFFNYGERDTLKLKNEEMEFRPKLDGSLIKVYRYKDRFHIASKSKAVAETVGSNLKKGAKFSIHELVYKALDVRDDAAFQELMEEASSRASDDSTFIFELTSPDNVVVTPYDEYRLTLLAVRRAWTGEYDNITNWAALFHIADVDFVATPEEAVKRTQELTGLIEGYVGYLNGHPVIKLKTLQHVAAHHLTTNLNPELNIIRILIKGESSEFLAYYPSYSEKFYEFDVTLSSWVKEMNSAYAQAITTLPEGLDEKEARRHLSTIFRTIPASGMMFSAFKNNSTPGEYFWNVMNEDGRYKAALEFFKTKKMAK